MLNNKKVIRLIQLLLYGTILFACTSDDIVVGNDKTAGR
jgi:hypothetical protein